MITTEIYRDTHPPKWTMTISELTGLINRSPVVDKSIYIWGNGKGAGKSTALQYLSSRTDLLCVDGDVMTVLLQTLTDFSFDDVCGLRIDKIAKGVIRGYTPWGKHRKPIVAKEILDWEHKVFLSTPFHGMHHGTTLVILPSYNFYVKNMSRRTDQMLQDNEGSLFGEYIRASHMLVPEYDFNINENELIDHVTKFNGGKDIFFIPNHSREQLSKCLDVFADSNF